MHLQLQPQLLAPIDNGQSGLLPRNLKKLPICLVLILHISSRQTSNLHDGSIHVGHIHDDQTPSLETPTMSELSLTTTEVQAVLKSLDITKAVGID